MGVTLAHRGSSGGRWTVTGVPGTMTTRLTVTAPAGVALTSSDARCSAVGTTKLSCRVGNGAGAFMVGNATGSPATVSVALAPPAGYDDPHPGNNAASLSFS